jgi:hypothetical protein
LVNAPRDDALSVPTERHGRDGILVPQRRADLLPGRRVPPAGRRVIATGEYRSAIGAEGGGQNPAPMRERSPEFAQPWHPAREVGPDRPLKVHRLGLRGELQAPRHPEQPGTDIPLLAERKRTIEGQVGGEPVGLALLAKR